MKTIKSALLGIKTISDGDENDVLPEVEKILKEHRAVLIRSILKDTATYVRFKFEVKVTPALAQDISGRLVDLKEQFIDMKKYHAITDMVQTRAMVILSNEPFYRDIDEEIGRVLNHKHEKSEV
jgi:hypothetical protein